MHVGKITFFRIRSMSPDGPTAPDKINAETKPFHIAGIAENMKNLCRVSIVKCLNV